MNRLVAVGFRQADIVLEPPQNRPVSAVGDAQRAVAIGGVVDDDAEGHNIGQLLECDVLAPHLVPDRIGQFLAAGYLGGDPFRLQQILQLLDDPFDQVAATLAQVIQPRNNGPPRLRMQFGERHIGQRVVPILQADAFGQRCVDVHRFAGDTHSFFAVAEIAEGAHIVQPVGQFHQQHTDIARHGDNQLAEIDRLFRLIRL